MLQAQPRLPQNKAADQGQRSPENQRRRGFDARVAVGMLGIGRMGALTGGVNDQKIGEQIRERMQAVGD